MLHSKWVCLYSKYIKTGPGPTSLVLTLTIDPVVTFKFIKSDHSTQIALNPL